MITPFIFTLFTVALIPVYMMAQDYIKERRLNKKIKSIRVGLRYEDESNHRNPFKKGTDIKTVIDIKEGYILYKDNTGHPYSCTIRRFAKDYVWVRDMENIDFTIR